MRVRELKIRFEARPDLPAYDGRYPLENPAQCAQFLAPILGQEACEVFGVILLDGRYRPSAWTEVSRGTLTETLVHPREVFKPALLANSAAVILAHNHPSGDPSPSPADTDLTSRLRAAGDLLGITVLDHVIIGHDGRYYSFKEGGRI